jgi:iron complex outermembrane receptor protein
MLNLESGSFNLTKGVKNFPPLKITRIETFELGYKGILSNKIAIGLDLYHNRFKDFIGPWVVGTPNVFLDPNTLSAFLSQHFTEVLSDPNNAELNTYLLALDNLASGGNGNGSAVDELTNLFVNGTAFIPLGTVSPIEGFDPTAIYFLRHQFGNISLTGLDLSFTYFMNKQWNFSGNYSYISQNFFENVDDIDNIVLNTPKHKLGALLQYKNSRIGLSSQLRFRFVDSFRVEDGAFVGKVNSYSVLDLNVSYILPFSNNTQIMLSILNFTDNKHREYLGVPEIGRLSIVRLTHTF